MLARLFGSALILAGLSAGALAQQSGDQKGVVCSGPTPFHCAVFGAGFTQFHESFKGKVRPDRQVGAEFCARRGSSLVTAKRRPWPGGPGNEVFVVDVTCTPGPAVRTVTRPAPAPAAPPPARREAVEPPRSVVVIEEFDDRASGPRRPSRSERAALRAERAERARDRARSAARVEPRAPLPPPPAARSVAPSAAEADTPQAAPRPDPKPREEARPREEPAPVRARDTTPDDSPKPVVEKPVPPEKPAPARRAPVDESISYEHF